MSTSSDHAPEISWWRAIRRSAVQFLIMFVLYVLSTGPMYWYCYSAYHLRGSTFLAKLYLPLVLASRIEIVDKFFDWYIGLWIG